MRRQQLGDGPVVPYRTAGTRGPSLRQMRMEQAGDGPGQRAVIDRNLGAREHTLMRRMRYLRRSRPGPIR